MITDLDRKFFKSLFITLFVYLAISLVLSAFKVQTFGESFKILISLLAWSVILIGLIWNFYGSPFILKKVETGSTKKYLNNKNDKEV